MMNISRIRTKEWTVKQAILLAAACLSVGIAGGWSIRASQTSPVTSPVTRPATGTAPAAPVSIPPTAAATPPPPAADPSQLRAMADAQAAPLVAKLKADSLNPDLLASIGNVYYDARQYPAAIDFYGRALTARPTDASIRTDMGTAYWFMGDADRAIAEFNKALTYVPNSANTLFNRGLVKWQGKKDSTGAIADWEHLMAVDPAYPERDKVKQMLAEVKSHAALTSQTADR